MKNRSIQALLLGAALLTIAPAARADKAAAEALFNAGVASMQAGNYNDACPKLAASQKEEPHPVTLFNLGLCYEKQGKSASAWTAYKDSQVSARETKREPLEAQARAAAAAIEPKLSKLTINATPVQGMTIKRDGVDFSLATVGVPVAIDPGEHEITAEAPGFAKQSVRVTVGKDGEVQTVTIPALVAAAVVAPGETTPPPADGPVVEEDGSTQRTVAYILGGVGVAGIGLGAVMGIMASGDKSAAEDDVTLCPNKKCTPDGRAKIDSAETKALVSTIGFGVGAAALGTGIVLYLMAPSGSGSDAAAPAAGPPSARLIPLFDPNGGGVGVIGTF